MGKPGRAKPLKQINFPPWATASNSNTEPIGYVKIGVSVLQSSVFKALPASPQILYIYLLGYCTGQQSFRLSCRRAQELFGFTRPTYLKALHSLIDCGFIEEIDTGNLGQYETRSYRLITAWKSRLTIEERERFNK